MVRRRSVSNRTNHAATRSNRGHQKAQTSGCASSLPKASWPKPRQLFQRVGGEGVGVGFDEGVEGLVDELAALGRTRIGGDGFQGVQPQHAAGVDRVGVAHPRFDLGDGEGARAGGEGWARLGGLDGADFLGAVELFDPGQPLLRLGVDDAVEVEAAKHGVQAQQPAGGDGGGAVHALGSGQDDAGSARGLDEIMGGDADLTFRDGEAEGFPHRAG